MSVEFIYDSTEDYSPQRDNFLTPVYFTNDLLIEFIYNPKYNCDFASETYGTLNIEGNLIPFGVNSASHLICWLGDIKELSEEIKYIFKSKNIQSDKNIESEFKEAQLNAQFTEEIIEVKLFLTLNKINALSSHIYNFNLFNNTQSSIEQLFHRCSKYKRITFNNEEDFKRIISDLNEKLIESLNRNGMKNYLISKNMVVPFDRGSLKILEIFAKNILLDSQNKIAPLFYLSDLRIWADHSDCQNKFEGVVSNLELDAEPSFDLIYKNLIQKIQGTLTFLLNKLQERS